MAGKNLVVKIRVDTDDLNRFCSIDCICTECINHGLNNRVEAWVCNLKNVDILKGGKCSHYKEMKVNGRYTK